jgi:hypothetical protein
MDHASLISALDYSELTGAFTWRKTGKAAGCVNRKGYKYIGFGGSLYRANRLAWFYVNGAWPSGQVDHIDGNRLNDAYSNLRDVTAEGNQRNRRRGNRGSSSPLLGVSWNAYTKKWRSQISVGKQTVHLGLFKTELEAHEAYLSAKQVHHLIA